MTALSFTDFRESMDFASKLEKARREYKEGKTVSLKSHEDIDKYFESM